MKGERDEEENEKRKDRMPGPRSPGKWSPPRGRDPRWASLSGGPFSCVLSLKCTGPRSPTWPGRSGRAGAQGSGPCGHKQPPGRLPGAAALPRVPHQRGWEAVAMGRANKRWSQGLRLRGNAGQGALRGRGEEGQVRGEGELTFPGLGLRHWMK